MTKSSRLIINSDKIDYMRKYEDIEFINLISEIKSSTMRAKLYEELKYYVPLGLKNNKNNAIRYGIRTQNEFIDSFKLRTNKTIITESKMRIKNQELALDTIAGVFIWWCREKNLIEDDKVHVRKNELSSEQMVRDLIDKNNKQLVPKEDIITFYRFNPYLAVNEDLENSINSLEYSKNDIENDAISIRKTSNKEIEELLEQNYALEEDKKVLLEANEYLKKELNQLRISNPQKMKKSLEDKIKTLEEEIETYKNNSLNSEDIYSEETNENQNYYEKYMSLKKTFDKFKDLKISELDKKVHSDKKYKQLIMSLILHRSDAAKLLVKHLDIPDSVRDVIIEARSQVGDLQAQAMDLEEYIKTESVHNSEHEKHPVAVHSKADETTNTQTLYTYDEPEEAFDIHRVRENIIENIKYVYNEKSQYVDSNKIKDLNFIISEDEKILEIFELESNNIPICRVTVETDWCSPKDWFGKYEEGVFVPSKTCVSDYYEFVKNTMELPFGIVVFDSFNKIPPEIYIEPFIESINTKGFYCLEHSSLVKDGSDFARIEKLHNLKFILIKSKNTNSFDIPQSMKKYEIGV